jgi:hypothetical protein
MKMSKSQNPYNNCQIKMVGYHDQHEQLSEVLRSQSEAERMNEWVNRHIEKLYASIVSYAGYKYQNKNIFYGLN